MRRVITVPESRPAGAENSNHGRHLRSRFRHAWRRASAPATVAKVARHFGLSASDVHCKSTSDLVGQLRVWPRHHARDLQVLDLAAKEQRTQQETGGLTQLLAQLAHARTRVVMLQLKMFGSIAADAHEPSRFPAWMQVHNATPPQRCYCKEPGRASLPGCQGARIAGLHSPRGAARAWTRPTAWNRSASCWRQTATIWPRI